MAFCSAGADELVASLLDPERPTFLFGCTPPAVSTDDEQAALVASKFAERGRVLAVDGYVVYDVQDESVRTEAKRPFPYRELREPAWFASLLAQASHKGCVVYKAVTSMESEDAFLSWVEECVDKYGHRALNIVGAPSTSAESSGPSTKQASLAVAAREGVEFGAVCIAERHLAKANEHAILARKGEWGAEWFITQGIYDAEPMIKVINEYGSLCRKSGARPRKIVLTFTPCGRRKTLEFIKWLGMRVPDEVEARIFADQTEKKRPVPPVEISCTLLCEHLSAILEATRESGVPLGINVESVSGYKDEIDATHDLFRSLQAILLDAKVSPWVIRWSRVAAPPAVQLASAPTRRALVAEVSRGTPARACPPQSDAKEAPALPISLALVAAVAAGAAACGLVVGAMLGRRYGR